MKSNSAFSGKARLCAGAGFAALTLGLFAAPASAQNEGAVNATGQSPAASSDGAIVVTGTRIATPEIESANPVYTFTAENIERSGEINVAELLAQTPALFGSETNYDSAGSQAGFGDAGLNRLNLRNLGVNRTLVLVNGRRHIAGSSGTAAVDVNTIPVALIDRVDVLTGGASAIYGADGVSGVVNFIMKRDFEGLDLRAQQGISDYGDAEESYISATAGKNFGDGRGNIAVSYQFRRQGRVAFADRPFGQPAALNLVQNPDDLAPDDPNVPDNILLGNLGYADSSPGGAVAVTDFLISEFNGDGSPYDPGVFLPQSGFLAVGGDNTPINDYQGDLQAATKSHIFNVLASFEVAPGIRLFAEGKYVDAKAFSISQPSFDFYNYIPEDNPFIPAPIRNALVPGGLAFYGFNDGVFYSRDNFDFGRRAEDIDRELFRGVIGVDGEISENARFEISYVYGQNKTKFINTNNRIRDRFFAALDAVDEGEFLTGTPNGNIVCRSDLNGGTIVTRNLLDIFDDNANNDFIIPETFAAGSCVPLNIFGEGSPSQAAIDFVQVDLRNDFKLTEHVVSGFVDGDFERFFSLPGGAIGYAFGAEYRKEKSVARFDPISRQVSANDPRSGVLMDLGRLANESGGFDVYEGFAELRAPVLADMPFAHRLDLGAAIRFSDYSTIGTTTTWKVDGVYAPIPDITFRGSYSEAVRAPNITELFSPRLGTFLFLEDPCSPSNIDQGTEFRAANCEALITGLGVDFSTFDFESSVQSSASIAGFSGGNQNLDEEEAKIWTAGVVLTPRFIPNLSFTADWYDINLQSAINTATLQETTEFCVDSATLDNVFCDSITRSNVNAFVTSYELGPQNVAFFETAGADFTLRYAFDAGNIGRFDVRGVLGYLDKLRFLPAPAGVIDDDRGEIESPKWSGTADVTWSKDLFSLTYGVNYVGRQLRFGNDVLAADPDSAAPDLISTDPRLTHDLQLRFNDADERFTFYVGANNFTNEKPDVGLANEPVSFRGRFFYAGVKITSDVLGF